MKKLIFIFVAVASLLACKQTKTTLPKYGQVELPSTYTNQLGANISQADLKGKVFITDFVFTHCPSICPKMANGFLEVQEAFEGNDNLRLLSFSIDPERDTVERLRAYTKDIGTDDSMWYFLRAEQAIVDKTAAVLKTYQEADENAPGGFNHRDTIVLIDKDGEVRGYYNGTNPEDIQELIAAIKQLI